MATDEFTAVTISIPVSLKERIKSEAENEDRNISQFVRFHIGKLLNERETETGNTSEEA